jgi:hypothetical protein
VLTGLAGFEEGQRIHSIVFVDEGWWQGSLNGKTGLFPSSYVELEE